MITDDNIDRVTVNFINDIQFHFNNMAPILKIKTNKDKYENLSVETGELMKKKM